MNHFHRRAHRRNSSPFFCSLGRQSRNATWRSGQARHDQSVWNGLGPRSDPQGEIHGSISSVRMRLSLGRGTKAAKRCMNSSGESTIGGRSVLVWAFELQDDVACAVAFKSFDIGRERDHLAIVLLLQPFQNHRSIESSGISQHDFVDISLWHVSHTPYSQIRAGIIPESVQPAG